MGGTKRFMEDQEAKYNFGVAMCVESGALEECEEHPGSYFEGEAGQDGLEPAYRSANAKITSGELEMDRGEATDAIKAAYEDNSGIDYCPSCDRRDRE